MKIPKPDPVPPWSSGSGSEAGDKKPPFRPASKGPNTPNIPWKGILFVVIAGFVLIFLRDCFVLVQAGERAVIYSKLSGVKPYQLAEGLHLNVPVIYEPTIYDTKTLTYTMSGGVNENVNSHRTGDADSTGQVPDDSLVALTADGLPVTLDLSVRFHVDPTNVWRLHQEIGPEYVDKIVRPQSRATARMAFAEFPVIDVYSGKRQAIVDQVQRELKERFAQSYLVLDEVLLRDIRFPAEFQAAIEQKQVAQQAAQQMVFEVQRAESERQQKIIEAQGEAAAIAKKAAALAAHPQLVQYEYVQRLPENARVVVTDSKTIINMGDFLKDSGTGPDTPRTRRVAPTEEGQ